MFSLLQPAEAAEDGKHLFILSGQSNMQGHRPDEAFTPAVKAALGTALERPSLADLAA